MSRSISLAVLAIAALLSTGVVACADTDQPDKYEAFGGSGSGTQSSDLTSATKESAAEEETAATPKTEDELAKEDQDELSNHASKSTDRGSRLPLKGD